MKTFRLRDIEEDYEKWYKGLEKLEKERWLEEEAKKWAKIVEDEKKAAQAKLDDMMKAGPPKAKTYYSVNVLDYKTACEMFRLAVNGGFNAKVEKQCAGKYLVSWWA